MEAFVSLCSKDSYVPGALVWVESLRNTGTTRDIVVMVTTEVSPILLEALSAVASSVLCMEALDSVDQFGHKEIIGREELRVTYTKLQCWTLLQYTKVVFMDADTLVLQNIDDLFEREEFSACPDPGWPDCFNSGVFVCRPSLETFEDILRFARAQDTFDGGDQGLLNLYYSDWAYKDLTRHLPFVYNCVTQAFTNYRPAFVYYRSTIRVVHFIGEVKPWHLRDESTEEAEEELESASDSGKSVKQKPRFEKEYLELWWKIFDGNVLQTISTEAAQALEKYMCPSKSV
jgi:glycogenin glucosyltransferase